MAWAGLGWLRLAQARRADAEQGRTQGHGRPAWPAQMLIIVIIMIIILMIMMIIVVIIINM